MPLLSTEEAFDVSDGFLTLLYGEELFAKWKELKEEMKFDKEWQFVSWLIDVANHYKGEVRDMADSVKAEEALQQEEQHLELQYNTSTYYDINEQLATDNLSTNQSEHAPIPLKPDHFGFVADSGFGSQSGVASRGRRVAGWGGQARTKPALTDNVQGQHMDTTNQPPPVGNDAEDPEDVSLVDVKDSSSAGGSDADISISQGHSMLADDSAVAAVPGVGVAPGGAPPDPSPARRLVRCPHCHYASTNRTNVSTHLLAVHERRKPHACPHCQFCCSQKPNLKRHLILKHGYGSEHRCARCGKACMAPSALLRHEKTCGTCNG